MPANFCLMLNCYNTPRTFQPDYYPHLYRMAPHNTSPVSTGRRSSPQRLSRQMPWRDCFGKPWFLERSDPFSVLVMPPLIGVEGFRYLAFRMTSRVSSRGWRTRSIVGCLRLPYERISPFNMSMIGLR